MKNKLVDKFYAIERGTDLVTIAEQELSEAKLKLFETKQDLINGLLVFLNNKFKNNPEDYPLVEGEQIYEFEYHRVWINVDEGDIVDIRPLNPIILKEWEVDTDNKEDEVEAKN